MDFQCRKFFFFVCLFKDTENLLNLRLKLNCSLSGTCKCIWKYNVKQLFQYGNCTLRNQVIKQIYYRHLFTCSKNPTKLYPYTSKYNNWTQNCSLWENQLTRVIHNSIFVKLQPNLIIHIIIHKIRTDSGFQSTYQLRAHHWSCGCRPPWSPSRLY